MNLLNNQLQKCNGYYGYTIIYLHNITHNTYLKLLLFTITGILLADVASKRKNRLSSPSGFDNDYDSDKNYESNNPEERKVRSKIDRRKKYPVNASEPSSSAQRKSFGHWPVRILAGENTKKRFYYLKCRVCTIKYPKKRRETSYRCKGCPNSPPLCPQCFEEWHAE